MEKEQDNSKVNFSIAKVHIRIIKIIVLTVMFLFPVIYLIYKTAGLPENVENNNVSASQTPDIISLEAAVKTNPTVDNLVNLSIAYINKQMPAKSIHYLKEAIRINPKNAPAFNNLGVAYTMLQQYQNGVDACASALQIDSSFQLAKNNLKWASNEKSKVLSDIRKQEQVPSTKRDVNFYIDYGMNYFKISDYTKSIDIWSKVFELDQKNTFALNNIGTAFMMKGQTDDAIALFKKVIEMEPDNQLAKNNLSWGLEVKVQNEGSIKK